MAWYYNGATMVDFTDDYSPQGARVNITADTASDLPSVATIIADIGMYTPIIGSSAFVIATGDTYIMKSDGTWVKQPTAGGSGMDPNDYYTKAETDAEITAQITDLDVPSIGGSTKYIKLVGQADGLVTATAGNIDASPTNGSTNLVQSGGVYTAIQNIPSTEPTQIPANSDLNSYLTPGNYYVLDATTAATLSNTPFTSSGFLLKVERTAGAVRFQTIIPANASGYYFTRLVRNSTTFRNWYRYDGTDTGA